MRFAAAVLSGLAFMAATSTAASAHLVRPFTKHQSDKQKLRTVRADLPHACASRTHGKGCLWLRDLKHKLQAKLARPRLVVHYVSAWLCIHSYEGSWTDSGDPYWGGLQMDRAFMEAYAPRWLLRRGYADRWTPLQQMWVAERAHRSGRGFYPWPTTARLCGLI